MAYCTRCGTAIQPGVLYCPNCGLATGGGPAVPPPHSQQPPQYPPPPYQPYGGAPATSGMQENVAGFLCYLAGWVTGIIFLLVDKRPAVRFHAAQSIVVFGGLNLAWFVLSAVFSGNWYYGYGSFYGLIFGLLDLVSFVAWIALMVMAYQGKKIEIPVVSDLARKIMGKV